MIKEHSLISLQQEYDWQEAFEVCSPPEPLIEEKVDCSVFTVQDVSEIIAIDEGENDEQDWIGLFRLKDGRYIFISAGCDFTGWDCQAGGNSMVSKNLRELFRLGISDGEKSRLELTEKDIDELLSSSLQTGDGSDRFGMMDFD